MGIDMGKIKTVDSTCRGCIYLTQVSGYNACDYIGATDKRRPCPAGKGCTVRKTGKRQVWGRDIGGGENMKKNK